MKTYKISTERNGWVPITPQVQSAVEEEGLQNGACLVYCPHTTAGITINENADPDVAQDLVYAFEKTFPDDAAFRHGEGNSAAHLKASVVGCSAVVPVENGRLALGTWQGIYFCEFDGPRNRRFVVQILPGV